MSEVPEMPRLKYPIHRYSTKFLLECYERVALRLAIYQSALWEWERDSPTFLFVRRSLDEAEIFLRDISTMLVLRGVDLDYLLRLENQAIEDVAS